MIIKDIIPYSLKNTINPTIYNIRVDGISFDSRKIGSATIFIAIRGSKVDGHLFLNDAFNNGALACIVEDERYLNYDFPVILVKDTRETLSLLSQKFYHNPQSSLKVIGVTGTNGKTTTVHLVRDILGGLFNGAACGTVGFTVADYFEPLSETTPDPFSLARLMSIAVEKKVEYFIMEASSHGLDQKRVFGINPFVSIFTSFARDHLDYHKNMENYFQAKLLLFKNLNKNNLVLLNWDNPWIRRVKNETEAQVYTYAIEAEADFKVVDIGSSGDKTSLKICFQDQVMEFLCPFREKFNYYNLTSAIATGILMNIPIELIKNRTENIGSVSGRMEKVDLNQPYRVFIDFAHNPEGLIMAFDYLKSLPNKRKIIIVFGAVGEGDMEKRALMGNISAHEADFTIITTDNPKNEDPQEIINHISEGLVNKGKIEGKDYIKIIDRKEAIVKALSIASTDDIVLIAGRGHEKQQIIGNRIVNLNDKEEVINYISKKGYKK